MRVLFVVKNMRLSNGVASYTMNYYRKLVDENFHYDFLIVSDVGSPYYEEILATGGKVFFMPSYKKQPFKVVSFLNKIFTKNKYDIIHCNVMNSGSLILLMAKLNGIKVRILHSHATQTGDKIWKQIRNKLFCMITLKCATDYFSCSRLAGDYIFGKNNYSIIPNAIDLNKFKFSKVLRNFIRDKENIADKIVLMTVGRFTIQKNPFFIVDIIKQYSSMRKKFVLLWFGNGELENAVKKYVDDLQVSDKICFMGARQDVNEYYSAADVFILPSLYEGLPVVGIEAQIAALPTIFSDTITNESKISDAVRFVDIKSSIHWCHAIDVSLQYDRQDVSKHVDYEKWNINNQAVNLKTIYLKLLNIRSKK